MLSEKKGEDEMINKKETTAQQVTTVSNEKALEVAKEEFMKYRKTFKKLAKN